MTPKLILLCSVASLAFGDSLSGQISPSGPNSKTGSELLSLPLSFEANRGQTDPAVKFFSRGDGYALFLTPDSAVFKLRSVPGTSSPAVVRMKLAGANSGAKISGAQALPGTVNYFMGNDPSQWTKGVSTFGGVNYQQAYQGIDLVYYGTQRQLEYDFIVTPGADPQQIALEFSGARPMLGPDGDLVLNLDGAPLTFRKPVVYQTIAGKKEMIAGSYKLSGDRVHFALGKYDHSRALVIDPVLSYLTYLGGSNFDSIGYTSYYGGSNASNPTQGVAVDSSGNVYVTGYTQSTDFPVQNALQPVNTTKAQTGFVAKLNPAGSQLIYSTYIGGGVLHDNTTTRPYAIAVDGTGSAYVTGFTTAPQFPVTAGAYQMVCGYVNAFGTSCPNTQSAFLTKLSSSGSLVYSTFLGHLNETGVAVAVDSQGRAYVAGNSVANCTTLVPSCFPTTANAVLPGSAFNNSVNPTNQQVGSAFISVFDPAGANLLYSSLYGYSDITTTNHAATYGVGVAVDASGNFYLAGDTQNNGLPVTAGAFQHYFGNTSPNFSSNSRGFVAKFNPVSSGAALVYATYLGGTDPAQGAYSDGIGGIAADAAGNAYVSGNASYNFPVTAGANDTNPCPTTLCQNRAFLAKINPAGSGLVWATFIGGARPDLSAADSISPPRLDANGNVYVSGTAGNNTQVPLVNPLQPANNFGGVYVTMYDPTGRSIYFSTVIYDPKNNGSVFSSGVDVDPQGNIYVAGYTPQPGLPTTAGAFRTAINGNYDGFIAKISAPAIPPTATIALVANAEGGVPMIAPNTWVEIKGTNLAPAGFFSPDCAPEGGYCWQTADFVNNNNLMPTQLNGVSVTMNGLDAYMYFISPTQLNVLSPPNLAPGPVQVRVTSAGVTTAAFMVQAQAESPSFFVFDGTHLAATHSNGALLGPTTLYPGLTTPAKPDETVAIYANGFGATDVPVVPGAITQSGSLPTPPVFMIGGLQAEVQYYSLVFPGEFLFNVVVPHLTPDGDQSITATYAGFTTQSGTVLTIQH